MRIPCAASIDRKAGGGSTTTLSASTEDFGSAAYLIFSRKRSETD
jgi:hypothetical protein